MFVGILALVLLFCMWFVGEQEFRTKVILTAVYFAMWAIPFVPIEGGGYFLYAAMALWCVVVGYGTFGKNFRK